MMGMPKKAKEIRPFFYVSERSHMTSSMQVHEIRLLCTKSPKGEGCLITSRLREMPDIKMTIT